jgi:ABC-type nitrate/sulfonate/bicarbonate transport system substrate-binding protein
MTLHMKAGELTRREVLGAASVLPMVSALGACAALPATPAPVSVIAFGGGWNLPLWAAGQQGFFSRHGIAPTLNYTADSKQVFSGLMEGRYHIAVTIFDNIVAYQEGQGEVPFNPPSDFVAFMGSDDGFLSLVAVPEVKTFADLRGKTISVDSMSNGFVFVLREMLRLNGIAETEVQWARAGGTDRRYAALMERQHAATVLRAPFDLQARNRGFTLLATHREVIGPYLGGVGAARRSWLQANEAAGVGFIRSYRDGVRWLQQPANRAAAEALLMANVPGMPAQVARQSCDMLLHPQSGFFADVRLDPRGAQAVMALRGRLSEPPRRLDSPEKYVDDRYWRQAMRA